MTLVKPGNRLYYYCSLETALELILPPMQLLLSPLGQTNDPRENKSFNFGGIWEGQEPVDILKKNIEISKFLRQICKVICFSQDHDGYWGYSHSRMWAYYGGNHKGICLLLDKEIFIQENRDLIRDNLLNEINYFKFDKNKPIERKCIDYRQIDKLGFSNYLRKKFIPDNIKFLYFTKDIEWESEHELRLIYFSDKIEHEYCTIKNSLKDIYLGVDFHNSYISALIDLCPDIDIYKLEYQDFGMIPFLTNKRKN